MKMGIGEMLDHFKTSSSSCSGSSTSNNEVIGLSREIYDGRERCNHCDMQLTSKFYVASHSCGYCDERCYRNFFIIQNTKIDAAIIKKSQEVNKLLDEKNTAQTAVNVLNSVNDELIKRNKELEKEIKIRDDGIDKFMLLDLE